jgi:hypothetical protein
VGKAGGLRCGLGAPTARIARPFDTVDVLLVPFRRNKVLGLVGSRLKRLAVADERPPPI